MGENLRSSEEQPDKEQTPGEIFDTLESAFEKGTKAELTVLEPSGGFRINSVFVEGLEGGILFVSESESAPVMGIKIGDVKKVELLLEEKEEK